MNMEIMAEALGVLSGLRAFKSKLRIPRSGLTGSARKANWVHHAKAAGALPMASFARK